MYVYMCDGPGGLSLVSSRVLNDSLNNSLMLSSSANNPNNPNNPPPSHSTPLEGSENNPNTNQLNNSDAANLDAWDESLELDEDEEGGIGESEESFQLNQKPTIMAGDDILNILDETLTEPPAPSVPIDSTVKQEDAGSENKAELTTGVAELPQAQAQAQPQSLEKEEQEEVEAKASDASGVGVGGEVEKGITQGSALESQPQPHTHSQTLTQPGQAQDDAGWDASMVSIHTYIHTVCIYTTPAHIPASTSSFPNPPYF